MTARAQLRYEDPVLQFFLPSSSFVAVTLLVMVLLFSGCCSLACTSFRWRSFSILEFFKCWEWRAQRAAAVVKEGLEFTWPGCLCVNNELMMLDNLCGGPELKREAITLITWTGQPVRGQYSGPSKNTCTIWDGKLNRILRELKVSKSRKQIMKSETSKKRTNQTQDTMVPSSVFVFWKSRTS